MSSIDIIVDGALSGLNSIFDVVVDLFPVMILIGIAAMIWGIRKKFGGN